MRNFFISIIRFLPTWVWLLIICGFLLFFPLFSPDYAVILFTEMIIVGIWAVAFNLTFGNAGLLSLGHAAFYGIGAYTCALLLLKASAPFLVSLLAAPVAAGLAALLIGFLCLRLAKIYFALLTLAFCQVLYTVAFKWVSLTDGDTGITNINPPALLNTPIRFYLFILVVAVPSFWIMRRVGNSPFGYIIRGVRDNPERTKFLGISNRRQLLVIFVISGIFSGLAGALYAVFAHTISPQLMVWFKSADPLLASILGGLYTFWGPAFGAAIILGLNLLVTIFTEYWPVFMGLIIIIAVFAFDEGVVGFAEKKFRSLLERGGRRV